MNEWSHEDTYTLIKLVEERPPLWDKLCAEYNKPKEFLWHEIIESLEEKYTLEECRDKWLNLRVTFKTLQAKSRHGSKEEQAIDWPFYWDMNFLEPPNVHQAPHVREIKRQLRKKCSLVFFSIFQIFCSNAQRTGQIKHKTLENGQAFSTNGAMKT